MSIVNNITYLKFVRRVDFMLSLLKIKKLFSKPNLKKKTIVYMIWFSSDKIVFEKRMDENGLVI